MEEDGTIWNYGMLVDALDRAWRELHEKGSSTRRGAPRYSRASSWSAGRISRGARERSRWTPSPAT